MDKSNIVNTFTSYVDQLHSTECSQKEKIACFQHITECILSPAMVSNINYAAHCSAAIRVLLLFCEDLDSAVRMSSEENLNKILRSLEKSRISRVLLDLYGEIRRNGNQRSLRICLNLFSYYAPRIKEKHVNWYALRMMPCMQSIASRKETQLCETLSEFVKSFGKHLQMGLTDSDTWKLFEVFILHIGSDCPVKRRCSSQNCISLIEYSRNPELMARHGLKRILEVLLNDHQQTTTVLGTLGFLRLLLPIIIRSDQPKTTASDWRQIVEIYDYCLYLLSMSNITNHSIINASLEVINSILQSLDDTTMTTTNSSHSGRGSSKSSISSTTSRRVLEDMLCNHQLKHNEYLKRRKSLKNQIFQLKNFEMTCKESNDSNIDDFSASSTDAGFRAPREPSPVPTPRRFKQQLYADTNVNEVGKITSLSSSMTTNLKTMAKLKMHDNMGNGENGSSPNNSDTTRNKKEDLTENSPTALLPSLFSSPNKNKKITSELNKYETSRKSTEETIKYAFKLGMQKSSPPSLDSVLLEEETTAFGSGTASLSTTSSVAKGDEEKIAASEKKETNDKKVEDDVDDEKKINNKNNLGIRIEVTHAEDAAVSLSSFSLHSKQKIIRISPTNEKDEEKDDEGKCIVSSATAVTDLQVKIHNNDDPENDDGNGNDNDNDDDDDDGFTTLLKINEPNQASAQKEAFVSTTILPIKSGDSHTSANVGNLIDAVNDAEPNSYLGDDKSQLLSDIDNESFNSIDFESEITIGGDSGVGGYIPDKDDSLSMDRKKTGGKSTDTIGSFLNILLSHSNTESVSKLFRTTPSNSCTELSKTTTPIEGKSICSESSSIKENDHILDDIAVSDSMSLESINSRVLEGLEKQNDFTTTNNTNDDIISMTASVTASTAILQDYTSAYAKSTECCNSEDEEDTADCREAMSTIEKSSLNVDGGNNEQSHINIGSIHDQAIVYYTARFVAARFLLTGQPGCVRTDYDVRVSIKNLSLMVVANCVRLMPEVLSIPLEIFACEATTSRNDNIVSSNQDIANYKCPSNISSKSGSSFNLHSESSSNSDKDFDHLDSGTDVVDFPKINANPQKIMSIMDSNLMQEDNLLLDIKDDHFGESTTCFHSQPLSKSANPVLVSSDSNKLSPKLEFSKRTDHRLLSKSEIVGAHRKYETPSSYSARSEHKVSKSVEKSPLKNIKAKTSQSDLSGNNEGNFVISIITSKPVEDRNKQLLMDVLLFFDHPDPILRGNVQIIIGNCIQSTLAAVYNNRYEFLEWQMECSKKRERSSHESENSRQRGQLKVYTLLAILIKGLHDDIHTVVIHALNAFDKIFPALMSKYLTISQAKGKQKTSLLNRNPDHVYAKSADNRNVTASASEDEGFCRLHHSYYSSYSNDNDVDGDNDDNLGVARFGYDDDHFIDSLLKSFKHNNETGCMNDNDKEDEDGDNKYDVMERKDVRKRQLPPSSSPSVLCRKSAGVLDFFISPKLLLNKLRLCFHNKYWLVQNKYAEVISNLNYTAIRDYYGIDVANCYENIFLEELLQLIGDDDVRIREHVAECLCHFIIQSSKQQSVELDQHQKGRFNECTPVSMETHHTNFNLLWDFFDYRLFSGMSIPLRDSFKVNSMIPPPLEISSLSSPSSSRELNSMQRQFCRFLSLAYPQTISYREEKLLAKVLYRMTNRLMQMNDKSYQFGIIYSLKVFLKHFNFLDYHVVWMEFNFIEICLKLAKRNLTTAIDLNCQNDLIDVIARLITGSILATDLPNNLTFVEELLAHTLKIINIYYHLFTMQKPLLFSKIQKSDIFINAKELAIVQSVGYFGNDHVYIQLYNILKCANDSYKITINNESGLKFISLLKTCINTLSFCIEIIPHSDESNSIKLIEEIIQYLSKLINYAPTECIGCLRQMLKSLFSRNYGSKHKDSYVSFVIPYFNGKIGQQGNDFVDIGSDVTLTNATTSTKQSTEASNSRIVLNHSKLSLGSPKRKPKLGWEVFGELLANGMNFTDSSLEKRNDGAVKHIKLFESLVIYCLTLFMKSNARVQAPILELLSQLLDLNVTYSALDAKNIIFEQIMNNLDLIEAGISRNADLIIPQIFKFLVQLTFKSDRKLITIPKVISIANNLLANSAIRDYSILALKSLAYEIFFMKDKIAQQSISGDPNISVPSFTNELDTQKEVVLGMVEKFIDSIDCQKILAMLLLRDRSMIGMRGYLSLEKLEKQTFTNMSLATAVPDGDIYLVVTRSLCDGRIKVNDWNGFFVLDALFKNCGKNVLSDSKEFLSMLTLFITKDVTSFSNLSYATVILENVILKTEEIYLVNHIKLYLKNHYGKESCAITSPSVRAAAEPTSINYHHPEKGHPHNRQLYASGNASKEAKSSTASMSTSAAEYSDCEPSTSSAAQIPSRLHSTILTNVISTTSTTSTGISSINEINYFAKVLCEKLDECLASLTTIGIRESPSNEKYLKLLVKLVRLLHDISKKDALQSGFHFALAESKIWDKYNLIGLNDESLQIEILKLFWIMKQLDRTSMLHQIQADGIRVNVQRTLLQDICSMNEEDFSSWNFQQVQQLFTRNLLSILITENFTFVCNLCEVDEEFFSLFQSSLIDNCDVLVDLNTIRSIVRIILRLDNHHRNGSISGNNMNRKTDFLKLLARLFSLVDANKALQNLIERTSRQIFTNVSHEHRKDIYDCLMQIEGCSKLRNTLFNRLDSLSNKHELEQKIIDEKWLFGQTIKFSAITNPQKLCKILLDINSENKLHKIFISSEFNLEAILSCAIDMSLKSMLNSFRNSCIQINPHIHYMTVNPLGKVAISNLMTQIEAAVFTHQEDGSQKRGRNFLYLAKSTLALMENIKQIESSALIYIESKFIDKFIRESLLKPNYVEQLLNFIELCCDMILNKLLVLRSQRHRKIASYELHIYLKCLDALLKQKTIWTEINQTCEHELKINKGDRLLKILDTLFVAVTKSISNTIFYKRNKMQLQQIVKKMESYCETSMKFCSHDDHTTSVEDVQHKNTTETCIDDKTSAEHTDDTSMLRYFAQVAFLAKFIETKKDIDSSSSRFGFSTIVSNNRTRVGTNCNSTGTGGSMSANSYDLQDSFEGIEIEETYVSMNILTSIGISVLRMNRFYAFAVTPSEIFQHQLTYNIEEYEIQIKNCNRKLPSISLEQLSDGEVLRDFVKRLSIFGFTTRQQFEEYFMTFLLLINKVYDENMVDQQEQFQIRSTCLEAILELLITYKTFPIVGNKLSHFHHTTRWSRITCNSISLKKLHKVQLIVSNSNVFYLPNLERDLGSSTELSSLNASTISIAKYDFVDNVIGTKYFLPNQFDLNFIWQRMEEYATSSSTPTIPTDDNSIKEGEEKLSSEVAHLKDDGIKSIEGADDMSSKNFRYFSEMSEIDFKSSSKLIFDVLMQIIEYNHVLVLPNLVKFCEICDSRDQIKCIKNKAFELQSTIPVDDTISHQHIIYLLCKTQAMLIPSLSELVHLSTLITYYLKSSHVFIRNATLAGLLCLLECCSKTNTTIGKLSEELLVLRDLAIGYINLHVDLLDSSIFCSDAHTKLVWTLNFSLIEWTTKFVPQCQLISNTIILANNFLKRTTNEELYRCILYGLERIVVINIAAPEIRSKIEKLASELIKLENEKFSIPALKLLLSCIYMGSSKQLENTELSNGIVQDDPEIIAQQTEKVDILLHRIKSSTRSAAWIYGEVLCQIIRDLVPPNEILTKVIKEFVAINQPHCDVIAMIVFQVFRSAIDSSYLQMLQDWLICSLPTFLALPEQKGVWGLTVIFLSASINLHLIKLFPVVLADDGDNGGGGGCVAGEIYRKLGQPEVTLFLTSAQDFYSKLSNCDQKTRFRDAFRRFQQNQIFSTMLQSL